MNNHAIMIISQAGHTPANPKQMLAAVLNRSQNFGLKIAGVAVI